MSEPSESRSTEDPADHGAPASSTEEQPGDGPAEQRLDGTAEPTPGSGSAPKPSPTGAPSPKARPTPFGTPSPGARQKQGQGRPSVSSRVTEVATPGTLTAAIGALLTFLAAFLTWATVEVTSRAGGPLVGGGTRSVSGLEGDRLGKLTLVLALVALVLIALLLAPRSKPWTWIPLAVTGGLIVLLAVLDLIAISDTTDLRERLAAVPGCAQLVECSGSRTPGVGVYLTVLGGLVVLVGTLLHAGKLMSPEKLRSLLPKRRSTAPTPRP